MSDDGVARREEIPGRETLVGLIGDSIGRWDALVTWLTDETGARGSWSWGGSRSGWELRFKRAGRPLTTLTPGHGAFTALVVLGQEDALRASGLALGERARRNFDEAHPYHDGRWLFLSVLDDTDLEDVTALVRSKLPARLRESLRPVAAVASV